MHASHPTRPGLRHSLPCHAPSGPPCRSPGSWSSPHGPPPTRHPHRAAASPARGRRRTAAAWSTCACRWGGRTCASHVLRQRCPRVPLTSSFACHLSVGSLTRAEARADDGICIILCRGCVTRSPPHPFPHPPPPTPPPHHHHHPPHHHHHHRHPTFQGSIDYKRRDFDAVFVAASHPAVLAQLRARNESVLLVGSYQEYMGRKLEIPEQLVPHVRHVGDLPFMVGGWRWRWRWRRRWEGEGTAFCDGAAPRVPQATQPSACASPSTLMQRHACRLWRPVAAAARRPLSPPSLSREPLLVALHLED